MFSVIIPLYNKTDYIEKSIRSVLNQSFPKFELIIVNDGSTDDGLRKVQQIDDERIIIIDQDNSGVSTARNNGVDCAKYEYVAFLDADDWWDKNFLHEMMGLIERFPDAGLYASNYFIVKNGLSKKCNVGVKHDFSEGYIDYCKTYLNTFKVPINCSFVIVTKNRFLQVGGFKEKLKFGEDFDLWIRISLISKVAYLNKTLAYSNQDVDINNRALGRDIRWEKEEHITFNLGFLANEESNNHILKKLLDRIRLKSLVPFYLNDKFIKEVGTILRKVNFIDQPKIYYFIYGWPKLTVKLYFFLKKNISIIKNVVIKNIK